MSLLLHSFRNPTSCILFNLRPLKLLFLTFSLLSRNRCDPHDLPGVLHISNNIDSIEGALETQWFPLNATSCPSQNYINRIASGDLTSIPSSLYNRTILLIGDSIDRANVQYTCHLLKGDYTITKPGDKYWPQANIPNNKENNKDEANVKGEEQEEDWKPNEYSERSYPTICYIKKIDLLIMNVFHFGLDKENYFTWKDQYGPPYHTELRIKEIALPLIEKVGREIDIVEFSSGVSWRSCRNSNCGNVLIECTMLICILNTASFPLCHPFQLWDLARFGRQDDSSLTSESTTTIRHLTLDRLQWFSQRFEEVLSTLNMNLPNIPQRFIRRLHTSSDDDAGSFQQWWQVGGGGSDGSKHTYYFPSWRVNELNNAIEEAVRHSNNQET